MTSWAELMVGLSSKINSWAVRGTTTKQLKVSYCTAMETKNEKIIYNMHVTYMKAVKMAALKALMRAEMTASTRAAN